MTVKKGLKGDDLSADKFLMDGSYFDAEYENSYKWGSLDANGAWVWSDWGNLFWTAYKKNLDDYIKAVFDAVPTAANPSQAAQQAIASQSYNLSLYQGYRLKAQQVGIQNILNAQKAQLDQQTLGVSSQVNELQSLLKQANISGETVTQLIASQKSNIGGIAALAVAAAVIVFLL